MLPLVSLERDAQGDCRMAEERSLEREAPQTNSGSLSRVFSLFSAKDLDGQITRLRWITNAAFVSVFGLIIFGFLSGANFWLALGLAFLIGRAHSEAITVKRNAAEPNFLAIGSAGLFYLIACYALLAFGWDDQRMKQARLSLFYASLPQSEQSRFLKEVGGGICGLREGAPCTIALAPYLERAKAERETPADRQDDKLGAAP